MRLKKFEAQNVHGFLNFDVNFYKDLTFITGENGGGKTTLVSSLAALIAPNFEILCSVRFDWMKLTIFHEDEELTIDATRDERAVKLKISGVDSEFEAPVYVSDQEEPAYRQQDREREYYLELRNLNSNNDVLRKILSLPDPMFLDIDRRARSNSDRSPQPYLTRSRTRNRNVFSAFMTQSLQNASYLVERNYKQFLIADSVFAEELRKSIILGQFDKSGEQTDRYGAINLPTIADRKLVASIRDLANTLPELLGLSQTEVRAKIEPFLKKVEGTLKTLPESLVLEDLLKAKEIEKWFSKIAKWMTVANSVRSFGKLIEEVKKYTERRDQARKKFDEFTSLVNKFMSSGGKTMQFDKSGSVAFSLAGYPDAKPVETLSSGEAQIFVILSHLMFNPQADKANVFIVDEPELSLHVLWQELFVDSVLSANPRIQYVLATHSPSIILDKVRNCKTGFSSRPKKMA